MKPSQPRRFRHTPPDRAALWARPRLNRAQLATLCGVTQRQVQHWTLRGYLPTAPGGPPRYDGEAIELCLLVGRAVRHGVPPARAAALVRETLARAAATQPAPDGATLALDEALARLHAARAGVAGALRPIEPLLGPEPSPSRREA